MGIFDWVSSVFSTKGLERTVSARFEGRPVYPVDDYLDNSKGGFGHNTLVYAAITELTSSLAEAPIQALGPDGSPLPMHPTIELLKRPNPIMSEYDFWEMTLIHMYLSGNAFWYKVRNGRGKIIELWPLRPDRVRVIPDSTKYIKAYSYEIDGKTHVIPPEDILHHKFPNPTNEFLGMSPLRPALTRISTDNDMTDMTKVILQNGGVPLGILKSENVINEHVARRIKSQWKQAYGGANRGELAILEGDMEYQPISFNMDELAMVDVNAINETRILMAFGVPPILIGAKSGLEQATYANYREARQSFWEETISTLQRRLTSKIESDMELTMGNITFGFDSTNVPALADKRQQKFDNAVLGLQAGLLTLNEARFEIGLDEMDESELEDEDPTPEPEKEKATRPQRREDPRKSYSKELELKQKELDLLRDSLGTLSSADKYYDRFEHFSKKELKKHGLQYAAAALEALTPPTETKGIKDDPLSPEDVAKLTGIVEKLAQEWQTSAYEGIDSIMTGLMQEAGQAAAVKVNLAFDIRNEEVAVFVDSQKYKFGQSMSDTSAKAIQKLIAQTMEEGGSLNDLTGKLKETFSGPKAAARATTIARTETIRAANEGSRAVYKSAGVNKMTWVASTDACPYCQGLDGTTVSVDEPFLKTTDHFEPEGSARPLNLKYGDIPSPPVHPGCRCTIIPEEG